MCKSTQAILPVIVEKTEDVGQIRSALAGLGKVPPIGRVLRLISRKHRWGGLCACSESGQTEGARSQHSGLPDSVLSRRLPTMIHSRTRRYDPHWSPFRMSTKEFQVVYVTGAPASGKSTLVNALRRRRTNVEILIYSDLLITQLQTRLTRKLTHSDIRRQSAKLITPDDVMAVDKYVLQQVAQLRKSRHVFLDTHAVTKERYGYRVTPFSFRQLERLKPTILICLYTTPYVTRERIRSNPMGRPKVTGFEAGYHTALQSSLILTYAVWLGVPVYFVDSSQPLDGVE